MGGCCASRLTAAADPGFPEVPGYGKKRSVLAQQRKTWEATGVVSLRDSLLKDLPPGLDSLADRIKVIDVSTNTLTTLPEAITVLHRLERMIAANNKISSFQCSMVNWKNLKVFDLSHNSLSEFPEELTSCTALETLKLSGNMLRELPASIGQCTNLQQLHVSQNSLQALPAELRTCTRLDNIDCSSNRLRSLPAELGELVKLRRFILNENPDLEAVPGPLLAGCILLHTLEVHGTRISREVLQKTDGYAAFEQRRQNKFSKAIGGNAMLKEGGVDEGVDVELKDVDLS